MKLAQYIPFYKRNLHLALPVVVSQIGQVTVHLADIMMVGHAGTIDLAAASFANNVFIIGMYFGMGITIGLTPLVGKAFGNNDLKQVVVWLKNGMVTHFVSTVLLTVIMFGVYFFLPFMGQTPEVLAKAKPYFIVLCSSYLPFMLFFSFKQFFEGIGNTRMAMKITLTANAVNIALNYLLIFGKFGFPEMGLMGAGIGTLVSRICMPLMFVFFITRRPRFRRYFILARAQILVREKIISVLKIGIPIAFQIIVEVITFSIGAIMMGWIGEIPLAAHQVAIGMASFTYMISLGISQANTIRVSHQMGLKDFWALKMAAGASTHLVLVFMGFMAIIFVVARNYLPFLFTSDPAVIPIASGLLVIAAIFQLFDGLQVVMLSTLRGMADVKIPMGIAIVAYLGIGIPTSYIFSFVLHAGPQGIWYGYLIGLGLAGIFFYFRFRRVLSKKTKGEL